jgi:hypothetical protein
MPSPEVADQIWKKGICRCAAKANRDASHFAACGPPNGFNSPVRLLQRAERLGIKDLSFWGELKASAGSPEKFDADFVLQIGKRLANGSLRDVPTGARPAESPATELPQRSIEDDAVPSLI